jgi:hypothetical protein
MHFKRLINHESGSYPTLLNQPMLQFNRLDATKEDLDITLMAGSRCTNMNSTDGGWGIGQITVPVPAFSSPLLWSWKSNIDEINATLNSKVTVVRNSIVEDIEDVNSWNVIHAMDQVERVDQEEGDFLWVQGINQAHINNTVISGYFTESITANNKSLLDAMILKAYNGLGSTNVHHYCYLIGDGTDGVKPVWEISRVATYGSNSNHYVESISDPRASPPTR